MLRRCLFLLTVKSVILPMVLAFVTRQQQCGRGSFPMTTMTTTIPKAPTTSTRLFDAPEPLAEEGSWQAFLDEETTGLIYYFDVKTGESLWEPPTPTFPQVRLPRKKQRLADSLRREYRRSRQQQEVYVDESNARDGGGGTSTTTVIETEVEMEEHVADQRLKEEEKETQKSQSPTWVEGIFDGSDGAGMKDGQVKEVKDVDKPGEVEQQRDWFNFFDDGKKKEREVEEAVAEAAQQKDWFSGIFGSSNVAIEEEEMTEVVKEEEQGKKFGLFDSFAAPFAKTDSATVAEPEKIEEAIREKPVIKVEKKIVDLTPRPIKFEIGSHILPHPAKMRWGGEDAVFVKGRTFGVFDGVSGAEKTDGVPLYSRTLANEMKKAVGTEGVTVQDMTTILTNAAAYADGAATGASTAVVASIGENGFLQALNIGDSFCMVVRNAKVTAKTREISHYWECPYQLSDDSPDRPRDGTKMNVELMAGDIVIMGSDGVFDNVNDDMLLDLVKKSPTKPAPLAKKICDLSRKQSIDKNSVTPYAKQAQRRGDPDYRDGLGGKVDDVSCVVVICK